MHAISSRLVWRGFEQNSSPSFFSSKVSTSMPTLILLLEGTQSRKGVSAINWNYERRSRSHYYIKYTHTPSEICAYTGWSRGTLCVRVWEMETRVSDRRAREPENIIVRKCFENAVRTYDFGEENFSVSEKL